jgi:hypothetical protein
LRILGKIKWQRKGGKIVGKCNMIGWKKLAKDKRC